MSPIPSTGRTRRPARRSPALGWGSYAPLVLAGAALLAYHNSFQAPFLLDDFPRIVRNPHIRQLWPFWNTFAETTRPVVQFTNALNYSVSGLEVWSYHALNLLIHVLAGFALLGVVRRTLAMPGIPDPYRRSAAGIALMAALLWVVHPLQTEAVTYIIQRGESLAGLFYLFTLYCVIRSAESARAGAWHAAAIASCALGVASKTTAATAPLAVLIYDRLFLSRSFGAAWARRRGLYAGLLASLGLLPMLLANGPDDWSTSAGFGVREITPIAYALSQPGVILHYLRLGVWPHPLCFDYGWPAASGASAIVPAALAVAALLVASVAAAARGGRLGFAGVWFFLILAPTSSFIPVSDLAFEHRLYLSLAAITVLAVLAGTAALGAVARRFAWPANVSRAVAIGACLVTVTTLASLTMLRNRDYRSAESLWAQTVAVRPGNARAQTNLGIILVGSGRWDEGLSHLFEAVRTDPRNATARLSLGFYLAAGGRADEALGHAREAVRLDPDGGEARFLYGTLLYERGDVDSAAIHLSRAVRLEPERPATHYNLGVLFERERRWEEAIREYREAVRLKPDYANAHRQLGLALGRTGRTPEGNREIEVAMALNPEAAPARHALEAMRGPAGGVSTVVPHMELVP